MRRLAPETTDDQLIAFIDEWASLLENENYAEAFAHTDHFEHMEWTPQLLREVIKAYGDALPNQRVTLLGKPTDITQDKDVSWWTSPDGVTRGEIWYDLNIDGFASDLTATFEIERRADGIIVRLHDVHVM